MNRAFALLCAAVALLLPSGAALAQSMGARSSAAQAQPTGARAVSVIRWVEEWDPASRQWVRVADAPATLALSSMESTSFESAAPRATTINRRGNAVVTETVIEEPQRLIPAPRRAPAFAAALAPGAGARFGPFQVLDATHAALVGATDAASPQAFAAMMAAYPHLRTLEFLDAPGTSHDLANLKLGRAIRKAGLATHVPAGGSARSGAVELFLAGIHRSVDPGAMFAVHSWRDALGREPADFAPDAPENRLYLDYYAEMGMTPAQARAFYAMTNSVPHAGARWMEAAEMARWIAPEPEAPQLAGSRVIAPMTELEPALRHPSGTSGLLQSLAAPLLAPDAPQYAEIDPLAAPRLAYADTGAALLDSGEAFP